MNYFSKPLSTPNQLEIEQQRIATRIFFLLLLVLAIVLIVYYGTERIATVHEIEYPTFEQFMDLQADQRVNSSTVCPCSTLTVAYEKFIQVNYTLHPICSFEFVQRHWVYKLNGPGVFYFDFRALGPLFFVSLGSLCRISVSHIGNTLNSFKQVLLVSNRALTSNAFSAQVDAIINTFTWSTSRSFAHNLALMSNITRNNGLMSYHMTIFRFGVAGAYPSFSITYGYSRHTVSMTNTTNTCFCVGNLQCPDPMSIYPNNMSSSIRLLDIPDLYLGCSMTEGIRYSTLSCLFNQSCIDLISFWLNISSTNPIDIGKLVQFDAHSMVEDIINELFVDQWNFSTSYRAFYEQCRPNRCTYTLVEHNSFWFILTTIFGLIGGLMKVLQIVVPHLVQKINALYSRCRHCNQNEVVPVAASSTSSFQRLIEQISKFNIFASEVPTAPDERIFQGQILSTRIFLVMLVLTIVILTIYSSQVQVTKTVTLSNPSLEQYISIYDKYSQTLVCPCANISIPQQAFLTVQPNFHQVCESSFVNPLWSIGILYTQAVGFLSGRDFRVVGPAAFSTIASLCQLSFTAINDGLLSFGSSSFVTSQVISRDQLLKQGQFLIDTFISASENEFIRSIRAIRDAIQANVLLSGFGTSSAVKIILVDPLNMKLITQPRLYNMSSSCACHIDPTCIAPAGLYIYSNLSLFFSISGFYVGCYAVEATLQSNLVSLYNQSWINNFRAQIQFDLYNPFPINTTALNISRPSQFNITTPISVMMQKMMTEPWTTEVNYSAYYDQCHPIECKYTYVVKQDVLYIITTIIGLIGGLVTIFQLVIPRAVQFLRQWWFNRRQRIRTQVLPVISSPPTNTN